MQRGGPVGAGIGKAPGRNEEGIFEKQKMKNIASWQAEQEKVWAFITQFC